MTSARSSEPLQLRRGNGLPLYQQIQQVLGDQIRAGVYNPSQPLPSIQKIALRMGVSQMTIRQAIKSLCELGLVYSRQGKGTFVSSMKVEKEFRHVLSFSEEARAHGATPHSRLLSFSCRKPSEETRAALQLGPDDKIFRLHRVRYEDLRPIGIECSCVAVSACPDLIEVFDPETSLYERLADHYGIQLAITDEVIEVGKASAEEARLLQVPRQAAGWAPGTFKVDILPNGADPMDVRYNMIQWVHRYTRGWSYGAAITDPRTGEIIKGNVTLGSLRGRQDYLIAQALLSPYVSGRKYTAANDPMLAMVLERLRQLAADRQSPDAHQAVGSEFSALHVAVRDPCEHTGCEWLNQGLLGRGRHCPSLRPQQQ